MLVIESLEFVNIAVTELEETIDFYTMFFDFDLIEKNDDFALLSFEQIKLKLNKKEKDSQKSENTLPIFSFRMDVDDFTDALQEIDQNKIPIVSGPEGTKTGEFVHILDPGGNLIELFY